MQKFILPAQVNEYVGVGVVHIICSYRKWELCNFFRPFIWKMTISTNCSSYEIWWVRRWLVRPIWARNILAQRGQGRRAWDGADGLILPAFHAARLVLPVSICWYSYATALWLISLRHAERSRASFSHELWSIPKSVVEALSVSLKHFFWPPWQRSPVSSYP